MENLEEFKIENGILIEYNGTGGSVIIPEGVTGIRKYRKTAQNVFAGRTDITEIKTPSSMQHIESKAFFNCKSLAKITFSENLSSIGASAFEECTSLTQISIPDQVSEIGEKAFAFTGLKSIRLPKQLSILKSYAFVGCHFLEYAELNSSLKTLGAYSFLGCCKLKSMHLPAGLKNFCRNALHQCSILQNITVDSENKYFCDIDGVLFSKDLKKMIFYPYKQEAVYSIPCGVEDLGYEPFRDCSSLKKITIPGTVTSIPYGAFYQCKNLKSVCLHNGIQEIGRKAFYECTALTEILWPESLKKIESSAFYHCCSLKQAVLPQELFLLEESAFEKCTVLSQLSLPKGLKQTGPRVFADCPQLREVSVYCSGARLVENLFGQNNDIILDMPCNFPNHEIRDHSILAFCVSYGNGHEISAARLKAFSSYLKSHRKKMYTLILREPSVLYFYMNEKILAPEDIEELIKTADAEQTAQLLTYKNNFFPPERLLKQEETRIEKTLETKDTVTSMKKTWSFENIDDQSIRLLGYKGNDTSIMVPEAIGKRKVTEIGKYTFSPDAPHIRSEQRKIRFGISEILLPDTITAIGERAFSYCFQLQNIDLPQSVQIIDSGAFLGCTSMKAFHFPKKVTIVSDSVLRECKSLESVQLSPRTTRIECRAFECCTKLTDILLPDRLVKIGESAFQGCSSFTQIKVPPQTKLQSKAFLQCIGLKSEAGFIIQNSILFQNDNNSKEITLPDSITAISTYAFMRSSAEKIILPEGTVSIDTCAFYECAALKWIFIPNSVTKIRNSAFFSCPELVIHGHQGSAAQKYAFKHKIPFIDDCL